MWGFVQQDGLAIVPHRRPQVAFLTMSSRRWSPQMGCQYLLEASSCQTGIQSKWSAVVRRLVRRVF
jgi:hypothetical protein